MNNPNKIYKIKTIRTSRVNPNVIHEHVYEGTLRHLIDNVFGYTLECDGHRWPEPKTVRTLVNKLNHGTSFWSSSTRYEIVK